MASPKLSSSPPDYGDLKPRVVEFLRELLMKGHKSEDPIGLWPKNGVRRLGMKCVRCGGFVIVTADGPMEVRWCGQDLDTKGADGGSANILQR